MIDLEAVIKLRHPEARRNRDYLIADNGDGPHVALWNLDVSPPTPQEVKSEAVEAQARIQESERLAKPVTVGDLERLHGE